jgi:hypothetical protein
MHSSQIYRIRDRRAVPIALPEAKTHPKGKVLEGLSTTANPGSEVTLEENGTLLMRVWGYVADWNVDYAKHGMEGFEGQLLFHYRFDERGRIELHDITVPEV